MKELLINSATSLATAINEITEVFVEKKYLAVKLYSGKRTLDQNSLCYVFYKAISDQKGDMTELEARRYNKYHYGLPILKRHSGYAAFLDKLGTLGMTYEEKLESMDFLDVTSLMSVTELREYLDTMVLEWAKQGVLLEAKK